MKQNVQMITVLALCLALIAWGLQGCNRTTANRIEMCTDTSRIVHYVTTDSEDNRVDAYIAWESFVCPDDVACGWRKTRSLASSPDNWADSLRFCKEAK